MLWWIWRENILISLISSAHFVWLGSLDDPCSFGRMWPPILGWTNGCFERSCSLIKRTSSRWVGTSVKHGLMSYLPGWQFTSLEDVAKLSFNSSRYNDHPSVSWSLAKSWNWYREVLKNTAFYQKRCGKLAISKQPPCPLFSLKCQLVPGTRWVQRQILDWTSTTWWLAMDQANHRWNVMLFDVTKNLRSEAKSAGEAFFFGCATTTIRAAFDHQLGVPEKKWFRSEIQSKVTKWYKMPFIRDRPWKFCFWSFGISSLSQAGSPFGFEIFDPIFP